MQRILKLVERVIIFELVVNILFQVVFSPLAFSVSDP